MFKYNQSTFQSFYFFKHVYIDSLLVENDDWVGVFNCQKWNADSTSCTTLGKCVGTRKYDRTKCGGGICDLPAMGVADGNQGTLGYLNDGEYPVFLIFDSSEGVYYETISKGDVRKDQTVCKKGYPFCYGWENQSFPFSTDLIGTRVYIDCMGKINGNKILDECGICGGLGPKYLCNSSGVSYCSEAKYQIECINK